MQGDDMNHIGLAPIAAVYMERRQKLLDAFEKADKTSFDIAFSHRCIIGLAHDVDSDVPAWSNPGIVAEYYGAPVGEIALVFLNLTTAPTTNEAMYNLRRFVRNEPALRHGKLDCSNLRDEWHPTAEQLSRPTVREMMRQDALDHSAKDKARSKRIAKAIREGVPV